VILVLATFIDTGHRDTEIQLSVRLALTLGASATRKPSVDSARKLTTNVV